MSRPLKQELRCQALANLASQVRYVPADMRSEQVYRCETLHDEIDPQSTYPAEYIVYRITGIRRGADDETLLIGQAIQPDLRLLIDKLSKSVDLPPDADEPMQSAEELAARFNVSTRTIARWRKTGLRWRWITPADGGARQLVFPHAAVEHFLETHGHRVERAGRFQHLAEDERQRLLDGARSMSKADTELSLNQIARRLARDSGRAVETIRLLLQESDHEHPENALFPQRSGPVTTKQKRIMARAFRMGVQARRIAQRYRRSVSSVYRIIHERRAAALRRLHIGFVPSPTFERDDADEVILASDHALPTPDDEPNDLPRPSVDDLPAALRRLYDQPALDPHKRRILFRRYNYLKCKAACLRDGLNRYEPRVTDLDEIDTLLARAAAERLKLVAAGLPVTLSVVRRHMVGQADHSTAHLVELLEQGNDVLFEAVETHDLARNQSFVTSLRFNLMRRFVADSAGDTRPAKARTPVRDEGQAALGRMIRSAARRDVNLDALISPAEAVS